MKKIIGYTSGVFDLFHIGHINILKNAKSVCDKLIVGVSTDELVFKYKKKNPVIKYAERKAIVESIKFVDAVIPQDTIDKLKIWSKIKFDIIVVGDDWYKNKKWQIYEKNFIKKKIKIFYFPYTKNTSSTKINKILDNFRK